MNQALKLERAAFALGLIGLGMLSLVYGDFALQWQPVPTWVPARTALAYLSGAAMVATGMGLLSSRAITFSSRVLFVYLVLWFALTKLPGVASAPLVEASWLGAGEIAVLASAGVVLLAFFGRAEDSPVFRIFTAERGLLLAKYVMGVALIPIGLSHFVYPVQTISFVPAWLPFRSAWAYLGGAGHIAAGVGVLLGIVPRLAATLEAAMIGVFTVLVWLPAVVAAPTNRLQWTGMTMSWLIAAGVWVVAGSLSRRQLARDAGVAAPRSLDAPSRPLAVAKNTRS
jgi:uncharacterized membrane protein